jgi:hypothetical protein
MMALASSFRKGDVIPGFGVVSSRWENEDKKEAPTNFIAMMNGTIIVSKLNTLLPIDQ